MITLEDDKLVFRFPEVHERAKLVVDFQRTLRIPDDETDYPLPPGFGSFPLRHVDDHADRLDPALVSRGGVLLPMRQAEALWINFGGCDRWDEPYPFAIKIAAGKINAVTGEGWSDNLNRDPQDYLVAPDQPWIDGYCVERGTIRQFVAMPLGEGYSAEEQITGRGEVGGLQISAWPMKAERYEELVRRRQSSPIPRSDRVEDAVAMDVSASMAMAPGGRMRQEIHEDEHGLDAWDQRHASRCFVTITNATRWMEITGEHPPATPINAEDYAAHGLPWFDYYAGDARAIEGADSLGLLKSLAELRRQRGESALAGTEGVTPRPVVQLGEGRRRPVREGKF